MRRRASAGSIWFALVLAAILALPASAGAKPKPITGKLTKPGYTVIALAAGAEVQSVVAAHGRFRIRPPAKRVTLQLRARDGTYAGPIVLGRNPRAKRGTNPMIVAVRAGAKLGVIAVKSGKGYAKSKRLPPRRFYSARNAAYGNKRGVPRGAGNFGLVRDLKLKGKGEDRDLDGIPAPLDVDDDGDLILNDVDRDSSGGASAGASQISPGFLVGARSSLNLQLPQTVNANAPGLTDAQVEAALPSYGTLMLGSLGIQADAGTTPEFDCGDPNTGLVYCRRNGSTSQKRLLPFNQASPLVPFPSCCDADSDGFGSLDQVSSGSGQPAYMVVIQHGAGSAQLGTGDLLIERAVINGAESEFLGEVAYVFNTVPALASYSDDAGNSATLSYPVASGAPGTQSNGFTVADGPDPDTDIQVTLTFWRPQRKPIPGETGKWIDIGHIAYGAMTALTGQGCPEGLTDSANDAPANPANTLSLTLNLTQCFASAGLSFGPGEERGISLSGRPANTIPGGPPDTAATTVFFKRP